MFGNRLKKRARHLGKWAKREGVTCFRVYEKDIPEIPLIVDRYDHAVCVSEFARRDDSRGGAWVDAMAAAIEGALEVDSEAIYWKQRARQRGSAQYQRIADTGERFPVAEGGHRFFVNLEDYLDTGLFLDHRQTRARVAAEAEGSDFLNLFAYTGAFTVYAATSGARSTTTVDLSNTYLDWTADNLALNGISGAQHRLERADVMRWLDEAPAGRWDLVVLDPP
ncbi:MAG: class I SAM-dependent methyltransferase, partial [Myxococcales bacterium]|nr:class I SAM-dependent methyltransferase [Myxococcales bacterium]